MRNVKLGELELEVLKVIWRLQPCTVQEVAQVIAKDRGLARTTVLTVMQRLTRKRYLSRTKRDGVHRYTTTEERRTVVGGLIEQFIDRVLDKSAVPLIAHLAESEDLTEEQAEALRAIVRDMERGEQEEDEQ